MNKVREAEDIKQVMRNLAERVKRFSENERDLWQKVPYLALQADGRSGYSDQYSRAYDQGFWAIHSSAVNGYYRVYVDLETGRLADPSNLIKTPCDEDIITLAAHLDELDAQNIVTELGKYSTEPTYKGYDPNKQNEWRNGLIRKLGLNPNSYKRLVDLTELAKRNSIAGLIG